MKRMANFILFKIDSMNFAIYSCNWTEMNLQCKKFILLKMNMDNASQMQLKITVEKVVNLEMFLSVRYLKIEFVVHYFYRVV